MKVFEAVSFCFSACGMKAKTKYAEGFADASANLELKKKAMRNLFRYRLWMTIEPEARYKIESFSTKGEKVTARACVKDAK